MQIEVKKSVYVLIQKGLDFVANYSLKDSSEYMKTGKRYLVCGNHRMMRNPKRVRMENFETYLGEVPDLPVRAEDKPRSLI